jgi:PAS domain S-box-containing protein
VIRFWNGGAERIFGFAAAEAVGQSLDIVIPETLRARHWEGYDRVMRTVPKEEYPTLDVLLAALGGNRQILARILPLVHSIAPSFAAQSAVVQTSCVV